MKKVFIQFIALSLFAQACALLPSMVGNAALNSGLYLAAETDKRVYSEESIYSIYRASIIALDGLGFKKINAYAKKGGRVLKAEGGREGMKARIDISKVPHNDAVLLQVKIMKFNQLIHDGISARLFFKKLESTLSGA